MYNGVQLIGECLECLAGQSAAEFRVIISDNASTDGTSDICQDYASRYDNFEHHRHAQTSDAFANFDWLLRQASDELFMWRAHDDLSSADYVERLQAQFTDPTCRLAVAQVETLRVKPDGSVRRRLAHPPRKLSGGRGFGMVKDLMMRAHASWIYGLWHRQTLKDAFDSVGADYGELWGWDHLTLLPVLFSQSVRADSQARFTQRIGATRGPSLDPTSAMRRRRQKAQRVLLQQIEEADLGPIERWTALVLAPLWLDKRIHSRSDLLKLSLRGR
ncbi:MAG: glycosyltransferase family 2 protein [Rhizobiales bacterium]|nr:glycosyltransferase family 2 protein [Hyphomicrobiales bacterium]